MKAPFELPIERVDYLLLNTDNEDLQDYVKYITHCVNNYQATQDALKALLSIMHRYDDGTYYLEESEDTVPILYFARRIAEQTI